MITPIFLGLCLVMMFASEQGRIARNFRGASQLYLLFLNVSALVGSIVWLGLSVYLFFQAEWYFALLALLGSLIIGAIAAGIIERVIGSMFFGMAAFIGWPAAAVWTYQMLAAL